MLCGGVNSIHLKRKHGDSADNYHIHLLQAMEGLKSLKLINTGPIL